MRWFLALALALTACYPEEIEMKRIDNPSRATVKPTYLPASSPGHFTEGGPLVPATYIDQEWAEYVQEELCNVIEAAGFSTTTGTPSDHQLRDAIGGAIGVKSAEEDTGSVSTIHKRVVVGASNSRASGENAVAAGGFLLHAQGDDSACAGGYDNTASGGNSACLGGAGNRASGDNAATSGGVDNQAVGDESECLGGRGNVAAGVRTIMLGGQNAKCVDEEAIAWGHHDTDAPTGANTNQHLTGKIDPKTGDTHFKGDQQWGGDPNNGTGATAQVDAANGDMKLQRDVKAGRGLLTSYAENTSGSLAITMHAQGGVVRALPPVPAGDSKTVRVTNNLIGDYSNVIAIPQGTKGTVTMDPEINLDQAAHWFEFTYRNPSGAPLGPSFDVVFWVVNPAPCVAP